MVLGNAPVEPDGSFYVQTPSEVPLRFELLGRDGTAIAAEKGWFWARKGEQRVCVGCHAGPERAPENVVPQVLLRTQKPVAMPKPVGLRNSMLTRYLIPILFLAAAEPPAFGPIRFEDVTRKAGISFTHSFGAAQLGSLLESTGAGAVWFDYDNDGYLDLYAVSGRPLAARHAPLPAAQATGSDAAQPSLPQPSGRHIYGRHRRRRRGSGSLRHGRGSRRL